MLAVTHAGVITVGNDVGQTVVDDDLDVDVRYSPRKRASFGQRIVSAT
jgi:hypothetical protein